MNIVVGSVAFVNLWDIMNEDQADAFGGEDWNHFTFGDCLYSMLDRDYLVSELRDKDDPDLTALADTLSTLPENILVNIESH